jgi:hypothetical protein
LIEDNDKRQLPDGWIVVELQDLVRDSKKGHGSIKERSTLTIE